MPSLSVNNAAPALRASMVFFNTKLSDLYHGEILMLAQQSTAAQNKSSKHS